MNMASLAADALIEGIDGPTPAGSLEGKSLPVLTKLLDGHVGFRIMGKFVKTPTPVPVLRVEFENGRSARLSADQIVYKKPMIPVAAADLQPGDGIEVSWDYREGYRPPDLPEHRPSNRTLRIRSVVPDGESEAFSAPIHQTGMFYLACGALLKA